MTAIANNMTLGAGGVTLIQGYEKLRLTGYDDKTGTPNPPKKGSPGVPTIGWGHTGPSVYLGQIITSTQADAFFTADTQSAVDAVNKYVTVALNQNEFDALVAFAFNAGIGGFKNSTLLKLLNSGDYLGAADELDNWIYAGKKISNGLINRRAAEKNLFLEDSRTFGGPRCFPAHITIQTSPTSTKPISEIRIGDVVLAFDPAADQGRGAMVPKRLKRLFRNTTTEWIKLTWLVDGQPQELVATPGHHMLDKSGGFTRLDRLVINGKAEVVLASGAVVEADVEHISYSAETAHLFEQAASSLQTSANHAAGLVH